MFGFIKHGDREQSIVNLNCKIFHLLNYVKKRCQFKEDFEIDVCDLNADVKHLHENQEIYANSILKEREELVLLRLEKKNTDSKDTKPVYVPLLNDNGVISEDFLMKLNMTKKTKLTNSKTKPAKTITKKKTSNNIIVSGSPEPTIKSTSPVNRKGSPHKA